MKTRSRPWQRKVTEEVRADVKREMYRPAVDAASIKDLCARHELSRSTVSRIISAIRNERRICVMSEEAESAHTSVNG